MLSTLFARVGVFIMGGLSIWHWLIVLVIVVLIFGTRKLGNVGKDLGDAVHQFKKGLGGDDDKPQDKLADQSQADAAQSKQNDQTKAQ